MESAQNSTSTHTYTHIHTRSSIKRKAECQVLDLGIKFKMRMIRQELEIDGVSSTNGEKPEGLSVACERIH